MAAFYSCLTHLQHCTSALAGAAQQLNLVRISAGLSPGAFVTLFYCNSFFRLSVQATRLVVSGAFLIKEISTLVLL